jgi:NitT/TauT family transport system substrate-binding protein
MKHTVLGLAAAAAIALSGGWAEAQTKVTYLFPAPDFLPAFAPFHLARAKGYFTEAGLEVDFQTGKGGADVAAQVAVGNADLGGGIGDTAIIVRANGLPIRGVALLGGRGLTQLYWRVDSGITGPADFRGQPIGVLAFQDTTYYNLLGSLAAVGMSKADVNAQAVGPGGMIQLMISGDLKAISGVPEWAASIRAAGIELGHQSVDSLFPAMAQAIIASDKTIAERPEVVEGVVRAVLRGIDDIVADPAQAAKDYVAAMPRYEGQEAMIEGIMRDYVELVYPAGEHGPRGSFDPARIAEVQAFYLANDIVQTAVPVDELFTNQFIPGTN